jgi:hypothetical protein
MVGCGGFDDSAGDELKTEDGCASRVATSTRDKGFVAG